MKLLLPSALILLLLLIVSCSHKRALFQQVQSSESNIHFNNKIIENDSINPSDMINVYNGGGVGIGDFNNDGLPDIYFTGNMVSNKLYLNKGKFSFQDITDAANVSGAGKWCRGVAVVDINNDGWLDMYVCASISSDPEKRKNLLYINQHTDKNGVPHFKEMAAEYGLADTSHSTMAEFFDYDNDGDLDMYLVVNQMVKGVIPSVFSPVIKNGSFPSTGKLFKNVWNDSLKHPVFTDVSKQAGITIEGYGHNATIVDINRDGWKDIYVSNDFVSSDILYINNHDGTFTDSVSAYFKHTSANAMGHDFEDINNDGLVDMVELDMNPRDNFRKKMMMNPNSYQTYQNTDLYGFQYQYVRNTLQLNQGPTVKQNDTIGHPIFSEISYYAGMAETDWSWTPLVADFDNDGNRDIVITNGYPKDVTDHDFTMYRQRAYSIASKQDLLVQIPEVKIHNYAFKNSGNCRFEDVSTAWGLALPTFSNGAVYADLDNDGDLDMIVNNINDEASIYKNTSRENNKDNSHFLQVKFKGDTLNKNGLGAWVEIHYDHGQQQVWENTPYRGYLSTIQDIAYFGLGAVKTIDTILVKWQNGKTQLIQNVAVDKLLIVDISNAGTTSNLPADIFAKSSLFKEVTNAVNINFNHNQKDFIDFNIQKLLPHKFSQYGPALAVGDVDGNGLDDIISGGTADYPAQVFLQQADNTFVQKQLLPKIGPVAVTVADDMGLLLFDADNDGDLDLYIARGGYQNKPNSAPYRDQLLINDGKGNFKADTLALPQNFTSKSCVRAVDFDKDGDLDLFVAGRVDPWSYPKPVSSFIYRNDSKNGQIKFTDITNEVAKDLQNIGMVCDANFTDFDNDGWPDLILAGEWMPVTFLKNDKGIFKNVTAQTGINNQIGWWNSIAAGDFDNDGDIDYIVGNLGENSFYKASDKYPVGVYAKDFDNNGIYDAFPSVYLPTSQLDTTIREYPANTRDDALKQVIALRKKFPNYKLYAAATMDQLLSPEQIKDALILKANNLSSAFIKNEGNGKFTMHPLPMQAQLSVLNGMVVDDFNGDGNLDVLINGNDYGTEVGTGRYDALNGLLLMGDGKGDFIPQSILQTGVYIPGDGKAMVKLQDKNGAYLIAASQNRGPLKIFTLKNKPRSIQINQQDISASLVFKNGKSQKQEFYFGSSFLSQSARFLKIDSNMVSVTIYDVNGKQRKINL